MQRHFDHISEAYYDVVDRVWYDVGYYHHAEAEFLKEHLRSGHGVTVDAGCGPGRHTVTMATASRKVVAVDISRNMLNVTRQRLSGEALRRVDLVQADIRRLPFRDCVADAIVNMEVLEHLPNPVDDSRSAIQEFRRIVRTPGVLLIEAPLRRQSLIRSFRLFRPTWKEIPERKKDELYEKHPLPVYWTFREEQIDNWLGECGFVKLVKSFVRVVPAGLIERYPRLMAIDKILEMIPVIQRWAREAMWAAVPRQDWDS